MANAENIATATAMLEAAEPTTASDPASTPVAVIEGAKTPEAAEKTPAELRTLKLQAQLDGLRAKNEARKAAAAKDVSAKAIAQERAELEQERARVKAEAAKWDGIDEDPVKVMQAKGLDVGEAFAKLAEAAQKAGTPEAHIEALRAQNALLAKRLDDYVAEQKAEKEAAKAAELDGQHAAARQGAERDLIEHMKGDDYRITRAFYGENTAGLVAYAHKVADRQRAAGKSPSYESIGREIEDEAKQLHASLSTNLGTEVGSSSGAQAPQSARGKPVAQVRQTGTLTNELASASASNSARKKSLADRQKDAERLLSRP